jgi:acyl-coenzyme A thioesterase PaaI-like protein
MLQMLRNKADEVTNPGPEALRRTVGARMAPEASHPGTVGRPDELAELAEAVRRLIAATVTNRASSAELSVCTKELDAITERLETHVPDPAPHITQTGGSGSILDGPTMAERMPFDVVIGRYTPLALPVEIEFDGDRAIGHASFTTPYEGPPGCVHGAVIAATFDIVLTAANMVANAAGLTVSLSMRYRRPTLLHEDAQFEAWVERVAERRVHTRGRILQRGVVTVEAEGVFARLQSGQHLRARVENA